MSSLRSFLELEAKFKFPMAGGSDTAENTAGAPVKSCKVSETRRLGAQPHLESLPGVAFLLATPIEPLEEISDDLAIEVNELFPIPEDTAILIVSSELLGCFFPKDLELQPTSISFDPVSEVLDFLLEGLHVSFPISSQTLRPSRVQYRLDLNNRKHMTRLEPSRPWVVTPHKHWGLHASCLRFAVQSGMTHISIVTNIGARLGSRVLIEDLNFAVGIRANTRRELGDGVHLIT